MKIFLSYSMRDGYITLTRLHELSRNLDKYGTTFADAVHNQDKDRQGRVEREILNSDLIVFIKTDGFKSSMWARKEIRLATKHSKRSVSVVPDVSQGWESALTAVDAAVRNELEGK